MARRRITSADVARLAGVSRTTVSFVLNGREDVAISSDTRRRVLQAAEDLGYHPNAPARQLAGGASLTLGLVLRQSAEQVASDALLPETLRGLATAARAADYRVIVEPLPPGVGSYDDLLRSHWADGIVVSGPRGDDGALEALVDDGFPVVVQGAVPGGHVPTVDVDNRMGARHAVDHLIARGHRRIGCITNAGLAYTAAAERVAGYRDALEAAGIAYDERLVVEGDFDAASGHAAAEALLDRAPDLGAIFAASDVVAFGAIGAIRARGRRVPGDVSVIGFDDIALAAYSDPPLTTIRLPARDLGETAGRVLIDLIAGRPVEERTVLATELVVRSSVGSPAGSSGRSRVDRAGPGKGGGIATGPAHSR
jgi:DNA-binding LacI/PurR family transcriptional regulator